MLRLVPAAADVFACLGALAVAVFRDGQHTGVRPRDLRADAVVAVLQTDAAHADRLASHRAHIRLGKADGLTVVRGHEDILAAVGEHDVDELVALVKPQRADAGIADVLERGQLHTLDGAVSRRQHEIEAVLHLAHVQHGVHALARLHGNDVDNVRAARGSARFGDQVALLAVGASAVREEENIVVR